MSDFDMEPRARWRKYYTVRILTVFIGGFSTVIGIWAACLFLTAKGSHKKSVKVFWTCTSILYSLTSLLLVVGALKNRRYLFVPWVMLILMGIAAYTMVLDWIVTVIMLALLLSVLINFIFLGTVIYQYRALSRLSHY